MYIEFTRLALNNITNAKSSHPDSLSFYFIGWARHPESYSNQGLGKALGGTRWFIHQCIWVLVCRILHFSLVLCTCLSPTVEHPTEFSAISRYIQNCSLYSIYFGVGLLLTSLHTVPFPTQTLIYIYLEKMYVCNIRNNNPNVIQRMRFGCWCNMWCLFNPGTFHCKINHSYSSSSSSS